MAGHPRILYVADAQSVHTRRWAEAFRDRGAQVHVASFRPAHMPGIEVHTLSAAGLGKPGYFLALPQLRRLARQLRPHVVHAQYLTSYGFLAAAAGLSPLVATAWGSDVLVSPRESALTRMLVRHALRRADVVTTVAEHMNAAVIALGAAPDKVFAAPFGVDLQRFHLPTVPRDNAPPLRIISTRNFGPVYSVHTLVEAVRQLHAEGLALRLDLVGAGPLRDALQAQVQAAGLQEVTRFHGHVDADTLVQLLGQAQVFVSTALSDGNNVSLNEAMACGCFPVATHIPANAQWLQDGDNGLLFAPGDATALATCLRRASDGGWRERVLPRNRLIVEQRADWQASVQQMQQHYERLIDSGRTR